MNQKLKKAMSVALLSSVAFVTVSSLQPKPAQAIVSAAVGSIPVAIVGGALIGVGILEATAFPIAHLCASGNGGGGDNMGCGFVALGERFLGVALAMAGFIVLNEQSVEFGHLSQAQASAAGLSRSEWMSYEEELAEVNAVFQDQVAASQAEFAKTGDVKLENSVAGWKLAGAELSSAAFSAVKKLSANAMKQAIEARQAR